MCRFSLFAETDTNRILRTGLERGADELRVHFTENECTSYMRLLHGCHRNRRKTTNFLVSLWTWKMMHALSLRRYWYCGDSFCGSLIITNPYIHICADGSVCKLVPHALSSFSGKQLSSTLAAFMYIISKSHRGTIALCGGSPPPKNSYNQQYLYWFACLFVSICNCTCS